MCAGPSACSVGPPQTDFNTVMCHGLQLLFSSSVMSDSLRPHGLQHARLPYSSLYPGACSTLIGDKSLKFLIHTPRKCISRPRLGSPNPDIHESSKNSCTELLLGNNFLE